MVSFLNVRINAGAFNYIVTDFTYYPTDKWVLTKIVTHTGAVVKYNYTYYDNVSYPTHREEIIQESNQEYYQVPTDQPNSHKDGKFRTLGDSAVLWTGGIRQLSSVEYPNGTKVEIMAGANTNHPRCDMPGTYAIDSIVIASGYDNQVTNELTYRLRYSYLGAQGGQNSLANIFAYSSPCSSIGLTYYTNSQLPNLEAAIGADIMKTHLRLSLDSIELVGKDHSTRELYYKFDYNPLPLPNRLSNSQDWYGYYNGKSATGSYYHSPNTFTNVAIVDDDNNNITSFSDQTSVPLHSFTHNGSTYTYGVDKSTDGAHMQACNLIRVTSGKRGFLSFFYKAHILANPSACVMPSGMQGDTANDGLCISSIVEKDGFNYTNNVIKEYNFSGGERFFQGGYYWYPTLLDYHTSSVLARNYTNSNIQPHDYVNGSNHGYSHVEVTTKNYNSITLQTEHFDFTNLIDKDNTSVSYLVMDLALYNKDVIHTYYPQYFAQYRLGKLWQYKSFDNNGFLVEKIVNSYSASSAGPSLSTNISIKPFIYYDWHNYSDLSAPVTQVVPTQYINNYYVPLSLLLTSRTSTSYTGSTGSFIKTTTFQYDTRDNISSVTETDSKGNSAVDSRTYNYTTNSGSYVDQNLTYISSRKATLNSQEVANVKYLQNCDVAQTSSSLPRLYSTQKVYGYGVTTPFWKPITNTTLWDSAGNVVQQTTNDKLTTASIWDTWIGKTIATVPNATYNDIAYTSFEGNFKPIGWRDDNKGNWDFNPANVTTGVVGNTTKSITGRYEYHIPASLSINSTNSIYSKNSLTAGRKYILSFWATQAPQVNETNSTFGTNPISVTLNKTVNSWKLYTSVFTSTGGGINISNLGSSTIKIDELRLYPADASMSTTTYEPLFGPSSQSDHLNNIIYYEYDVMGRLKVTRDINNNIITVQKTFVQDPDQ